MCNLVVKNEIKPSSLNKAIRALIPLRARAYYYLCIYTQLRGNDAWSARSPVAALPVTVEKADKVEEEDGCVRLRDTSLSPFLPSVVRNLRFFLKLINVFFVSIFSERL